jgi:hypothetical protein
LVEEEEASAEEAAAATAAVVVVDAGETWKRLIFFKVSENDLPSVAYVLSVPLVFTNYVPPFDRENNGARSRIKRNPEKKTTDSPGSARQIGVERRAATPLATRGATTFGLLVAEATAVKALDVAAGRWAVDMRVEAIMLAIGGGRVAGKRWNATGRGERKEERGKRSVDCARRARGVGVASLRTTSTFRRILLSPLLHDGAMLSRQEKLKHASVLFARLFGSSSSRASSSSELATQNGTKPAAMKLSRPKPASSSASTTRAPAVLPPTSLRIASTFQPRHQHVRCVTRKTFLDRDARSGTSKERTGFPVSCLFDPDIV